MTNWIKRVFFLVLIVPMAMCQAQSDQYQAGVHYEVLPQSIRTANPDKIEVNEVFLIPVVIVITLSLLFILGLRHLRQMLIFSVHRRSGSLH